MKSEFDKYKRKTDEKFKELVGIPKVLFDILVPIIGMHIKQSHAKGGRKPDLYTTDLLLMTLKYYRDYPTYESIATTFGLDKSNAYRWINKVEDWLYCIFDNISGINISYDNFKKEGQKITTTEKQVDVTECPIQRPKNKELQVLYYSGKKKKHTIKIQIIIDTETLEIVSISFDAGSVHDFNLFKKTTQELDEFIAFLADSGYQGITELFKNSLTPKKKSKNKPLTEQDKEFNKLISSIRISIEHVNCQLKIFKILSTRYRSRIKTFYKRAILVCFLYNYCL